MLLELTFRSLNNLLERFHHSTTFYILLSSEWHVPFQMHILPPLLLTLILVLQVSCALATSCLQYFPVTKYFLNIIAPSVSDFDTDCFVLNRQLMLSLPIASVKQQLNILL